MLWYEKMLQDEKDHLEGYRSFDHYLLGKIDCFLDLLMKNEFTRFLFCEKEGGGQRSCPPPPENLPEMLVTFSYPPYTCCMIPEFLSFDENIFEPEVLKAVPTRNGFGEALRDLGAENPHVVAVCADLAESTRVHWFKESFPDRYIEVGVAEQNMAAVASGLANAGKIPFMTSYATFSPGRNWEQIRSTICINDVPVKIIGSHAGVSVGPDGATHQALEDIALTRVLPNMTVVVPADSAQAYKATYAIAATPEPTYLRLARAKTPVFTTEATPFEIGKAYRVYDAEPKEGKRFGIVACGSLVYQAILAAEELAQEGIAVSVVNCATIKPLDTKEILSFAQDCDHIVTAEEHQIAAGLGGAIAEFLGENHPMPMTRIGMQDRYGESGDPDELLHAFGLDKDGIVRHILEQHEKTA